MNENELHEIHHELSVAEQVSAERSFQLSQFCSKLLSQKKTEAQGRDIIIRVLDVLDKVAASTRCIWKDLAEAVGFYPYLEKADLHGSALVRHEYHVSKHLADTHLHQEQMAVSMMLAQSKSVILSAPTSFGKSLLIEEIVASKKYKNVVIIQPTLALLDETRKKLRKYSKDYKLIFSTSQLPSESGNLFLLTAERVVEYEHFPAIDFFVIDEFYKLSMDRDDERAVILNHAFIKLHAMTKKFYMLGPCVASIPKDFDTEYSASFIKTDFATVAVDVHDKRVQNKSKREETLFSLLLELNEPTLIYCRSPQNANELVTKFVDYCRSKNYVPTNHHQLQNLDAIDWISQNIHPAWILNAALKFGAGMHHGSLPRHLGSSVVDYFNQSILNFLFCTSTLIEGVNTSAKNVVLYDRTKGKTQLDYFDYKNIAGRSGRMKKHFIGRVFRFHPEPSPSELQLDIPFFTEKDAPTELLIQMDQDKIKNKNSEAFKLLAGLDPDTRRVVQANKGITVEGQLEILRKLEQLPKEKIDLFTWTTVPNYHQLAAVLDLAWSHILKENEKKWNVVRSSNQLATLALKYFTVKSLPAYIKTTIADGYWIKKIPDEKQRTAKCIDYALQTHKNWFEYKLPKWLKTISSLQKFVLEKRGEKAGNYLFFANSIENGFLQSNLSVLLEFGIPTSAIRKLKDDISADLTDAQVIEKVKSLVAKPGLLPYESNKLRLI